MVAYATKVEKTLEFGGEWNGISVVCWKYFPEGAYSLV
jgi:hypothetical protein